jgi:hypothetical protein
VSIQPGFCKFRRHRYLPLSRSPKLPLAASSAGPWLAIAPGIIALRAPAMGALASDFFKSHLFVWFARALLVFGGLLIIAFHQYWSSAAAVMISLFGWILALRGGGAHDCSRPV